MAQNIEDLNQIATSNNVAADGGWPEGMSRSAVNDTARENIAAFRRWYEDSEWVDLLKESGASFNVSRVNATTFRVTDDTGTDPTSKFTAGAWCRVTGTVSPTVCIGRIASVGTYSAPNLDVVLDTIVNPTTFATTTLPDSTVTKVEVFFSRTTKQAAFHPVGVTTGQTPAQLPTIDSLSTHVTKAEGAGGGIDADLLDGQEGAYYEGLASGRSRNNLRNGAMAIWQRGESITGVSTHPNDDDSLCADGWVHLSEANDRFDISKATATPQASFRNYMQMVAVNTTASPNAEKGGIAQFLEGAESYRMRSQSCTFSFYARVSAGATNTAWRAAIIEWTGTEDSLTSDPISVWSADGIAPTLATNWAYCGGASTQVTLTETWQRFTVTSAPGATANNIGVLLVGDDKNYVVGDEVWITGLQLEVAASVTPYDQKTKREDLTECQRYFAKTYDQDVAPAASDNNGRVENQYSRTSSTGGPGDIVMGWRYPVPMRTNPTAIIYAPSTGNTGNVTGSSSGDLAATGLHVGDSGLTIHVTGNVGAEECSAHVTVEAEL